jgi:nucleotide-binding universal stress UspA family protein
VGSFSSLALDIGFDSLGGNLGSAHGSRGRDLENTTKARVLAHREHTIRRFSMVRLLPVAVNEGRTRRGDFRPPFGTTPCTRGSDTLHLEEPAMQIRKILVPTDFSDSAQRALEHAVAWAKTFRAEIHLLHAYQLPIQIGVGEPVALPQEFFDQMRARAQSRLDELRTKLESDGLVVHAHITADAASSAIVESADQLGADLIVMGTRGLTGMKHILLGSVAERTVRLAHCPVMTVKGPS